MKRILLVSATPYEISPIIKHLEENGQKLAYSRFSLGEYEIDILISGVGMVSTMFALCRYPHIEKIDLLLHLGIGGSLDKNIPLGSLVELVKDTNADLGVEEADGSFTSAFDLELTDGNMFPYQGGWLSNDFDAKLGLPKCVGISVNKVSGCTESIERLKSKYPEAQVESMEGFSLLYFSKMMHIDCIQLRAISNYVEPRNRNNWQIDKAISQLKTGFLSALNI